MASKLMKHADIFGCRIFGMRNLWEPATTYQGRPSQQPTYLAAFIAQKTRSAWWDEPIFAGLAQACNELWQGAMSNVPFSAIQWPVRDGDTPVPGRAPADWARGHWTFGGNSNFPIKTAIIQNGAVVNLPNKAMVKPGDVCAVSVVAAQNSTNAMAVKLYINLVLFLQRGEEINIGNAANPAELMEKARAQGLNVTGFAGGGNFAPPPAPVPAGFGAAPGAGMSPGAPWGGSGSSGPASPFPPR